jgi:gliding motility-associated-like protein
MKNKLLLFLLLSMCCGSTAIAQKVDKTESISTRNSQGINTFRTNKKKALIPPPIATAGSACKEESVASITVLMAASGGSGDIIEWFADQTSSTILHTGSIYGPSISKTTTYYVWSHSGVDFSVRVPVVASVYVAPANVNLTVVPTDSAVCEGTPVTFSASGGADLFEFSVNGVVKQAMSSLRTYTTTTLKKGETVSVKTRYGISFDGTLTEVAWGKGLAEDNVLSAPLSLGGLKGYINGIKISPSEDELIFGLPGKLENSGSILLFLDTKPGGFNTGNFGDVVSTGATVREFNFFNNNPSIFDSYFAADYCLVIAKDGSGPNYLADIIELRTNNSIIGSIKPLLSVREGNIGASDYDTGFEVSVLKSLIGYTQGDIKFFAFTMQNDTVTNSFLSPELTSSLDYGNAAVDYNLKAPNPVVVSADALIPCYKQASLLVNIQEPPTTATVGADQINCALSSGALDGNTPVIGSGKWSLKSGPGLVNFSDSTSGTSSASVDVKGVYVFTWTITNGVCLPSTADIKVEFNIPPTTPSSNNQTVCAETPVQTLTASATSQSGEKIVWYNSLVGGAVVTNPTLNSIGSITYYAESVSTSSLCVSTSRVPSVLTINPKPTSPSSGGDQTVCAVSPIQSLTAMASSASGVSIVWYDAATTGNVVVSPVLNAIGTITYYAESLNNITLCVSNSRTAVTLTINRTPTAPASSGNITECVQSPIQTIRASAISPSGQSIVWFDAAVGGTLVANPNLSSVGTITYYAQSVNDATACVSESRTAVVLTIIPLPLNPVSGGNQKQCALLPLQTLTALATVLNGESVVWYDAPLSGNVIVSPVLNSIGTVTYYAQAVNNTTGCISNSRTAVSLTIDARPSIPISGGNQTECTNGSATQTLTAVATGSAVTWYSTASGGIAIANPTQVGVGTTTYYAESSDGICPSLTRTPVTLTIVGLVPNPTATNQTVCANGTSNQTLTAAATGNTITWYSNSTGGSIVASPTQIGVGTVTYYAESSIAQCISIARTAVVLTITAVPVIPTVVGSNGQPTCSKSTGEITIAAQSGVEYSIGKGFQDSPIFSGLASGSYTISVRYKNNISCEISGAVQTINTIPQQIQFEIVGDCTNKDYLLTATSLANSYDLNNVSYQWKDNSGSPVGTNSTILNVSELIASTSAEEVFPLNYTLTVTSTATGCETTKAIIVRTIYCNIQKGISPDGNGSNDYFDLRLMDVKKLEIFNRYGIKVFEQSNYTDQWKGQSDKGENLPSATYYYVMEPNSGETITGWIYLIREK